MTAKWERQQLNQISGAGMVLENVLLNHAALFTEAEVQLIQSVILLLREKRTILRKGSPGGG